MARVRGSRRMVRPRLSYFWEKVASSYWFVPALMMSFTVAAAFLLLRWDDARSGVVAPGLGWLERIGLEGTRALMSVIAASMIGVAGVVFSITMVVLTLASTQFGPRLLRSFFRDTGSQIVLGTFVATFLYCLIIMTVLGREAGAVPYRSVAFALVLGVLSLVVLVYFIHHISAAIQASNVLVAVRNELLEVIDQLYPEGPDRSSPSHEGRTEESIGPPSGDVRDGAVVRAVRTGYIVRNDDLEMLSLAQKHDVIVQISVRPGEFVARGDLLARIVPEERASAELTRAMGATFVVGSNRTPFQDVLFPLNQLVEIAVRALSPGINDPFTAMNCLDYIGEALGEVAARPAPPSELRDRAGRLRVIAPRVTMCELLESAFDPIRHFGRGNARIALHLMNTIAAVAHRARRESDAELLHRHALLVRRSAERDLSEPKEYEGVEAGFQKVLSLLPKDALRRVEQA